MSFDLNFDDSSKTPLLRVAFIKPVLHFAIKENNLSLLYKCATLCKEWNEAVETYALEIICERIPRCFPLLLRRNFSRLPSDPDSFLATRKHSNPFSRYTNYSRKASSFPSLLSTGRRAFARQFYLRCSDYIASVRDTDYVMEKTGDGDDDADSRLAQLLQTDADMNFWVIQLMIKIYTKLSHLGQHSSSAKRKMFGRKKKLADDDNENDNTQDEKKTSPEKTALVKSPSRPTTLLFFVPPVSRRRERKREHILLLAVQYDCTELVQLLLECAHPREALLALMANPDARHSSLLQSAAKNFGCSAHTFELVCDAYYEQFYRRRMRFENSFAIRGVEVTKKFVSPFDEPNIRCWWTKGDTTPLISCCVLRDENAPKLRLLLEKYQCSPYANEHDDDSVVVKSRNLVKSKETNPKWHPPYAVASTLSLFYNIISNYSADCLEVLFQHQERLRVNDHARIVKCRPFDFSSTSPISKNILVYFCCEKYNAISCGRGRSNSSKYDRMIRLFLKYQGKENNTLMEFVENFQRLVDKNNVVAAIAVADALMMKNNNEEGFFVPPKTEIEKWKETVRNICEETGEDDSDVVAEVNKIMNCM